MTDEIEDVPTHAGHAPGATGAAVRIDVRVARGLASGRVAVRARPRLVRPGWHKGLQIGGPMEHVAYDSALAVVEPVLLFFIQTD